MLSVTTLRAEDLVSPKPIQRNLFRILLYIPGVQRALDYGDVYKIHRCAENCVVFETNDGFVIAHRGPYTLMGQKNDILQGKNLDGTQFFDVK